MFARLADLISSNRIFISRIFALGFFLILVFTESTQEGDITSAVLFLAGLVLIGIATVGRLWCSIYISGYKNTELITVGPYSITRNPLYFFSFIGFVGIGMATETFSFTLAFALIFAFIYPHVIKREEDYLRAKFGGAFEEYCARTPRFFPKLKGVHEPESYTVNPRLFRRTLRNVLWFIWLAGLIELVEALHEYHFIDPLIRLP